MIFKANTRHIHVPLHQCADKPRPPGTLHPANQRRVTYAHDQHAPLDTKHPAAPPKLLIPHRNQRGVDLRGARGPRAVHCARPCANRLTQPNRSHHLLPVALNPCQLPTPVDHAIVPLRFQPAEKNRTTPTTRAPHPSRPLFHECPLPTNTPPTAPNPLTHNWRRTTTAIRRIHTPSKSPASACTNALVPSIQQSQPRHLNRTFHERLF